MISPRQQAAFALGIELKSFSWMDEGYESEPGHAVLYGKYYNSGEEEYRVFSRQVPVEEPYRAVLWIPLCDMPLFKLILQWIP